MQKSYTLTGYKGTKVVYNGTEYTYHTDIEVDETRCEYQDGYVYNHLYAQADVYDDSGDWYTISWESFDGVFDYDNPVGLLDIDPPIGLEG